MATDVAGNIHVSDDSNRIQEFGALPTPAIATSWGRLKTVYR